MVAERGIFVNLYPHLELHGEYGVYMKLEKMGKNKKTKEFEENKKRYIYKYQSILSKIFI